VQQGSQRRRLVIPLVLAATVMGAAAAAVSTTGGCGNDHSPRMDAGILGDRPVDTPIV
jgi:hypothetical protein